MIKNLIFDFGGVILKHKSTFLEDTVSEMFSIDFDEASKIIKRDIQSLLIGKTSTEQFLTVLSSELRSKKSTSELLIIWRNVYVAQTENIDWELLEFIEKLKSNYRVYLLTDIIDTHDEYNNYIGVYKKFTKTFRSHIEKSSKFDGSGFANILQKINSTPEECIFIDDLDGYIKAARQLGIKSILYKNIINLRREFKKLKIKID